MRLDRIIVRASRGALSINSPLKVKALEGEIDQMVYRLYGLTGEEIAIVEGVAR